MSQCLNDFRLERIMQYVLLLLIVRYTLVAPMTETKCGYYGSCLLSLLVRILDIISIAAQSQLIEAQLVGSSLDIRYEPRGMDLTSDGGFWFGTQYFHLFTSYVFFV